MECGSIHYKLSYFINPNKITNKNYILMAYYQQHRLSIKSTTTLSNILAEVLLLNETI